MGPSHLSNLFSHILAFSCASALAIPSVGVPHTLPPNPHCGPDSSFLLQEAFHNCSSHNQPPFLAHFPRLSIRPLTSLPFCEQVYLLN